MNSSRTSFLRSMLALLFGLFLLLPCALHAADPKPTPVQEERISLKTEDGRDLVVSVYAPAEGCTHCPLVIFSHGNFATPARYAILLRDWAAHGMVVAAPLHTDSEEYPEPKKYPDSRATRLADWRAVDRAFRGTLSFSALRGITLSGQVIAAGHSYGALIALVAGGAEMVDPDWSIGAVRKPAAVIALSPPGTMKGLVTSQGLAKLSVPALIVTGTTDVLPGFIDTWQQHLEPYEAAAPGLGYALVFAGMNHYFNGAYGRPTEEGAQASARQVARLDSEVTRFIHGALTGGLPNAETWAKRSDAMVEARAH